QFPDVAADWHPTRNGNLSPDQVVAGSQRKVWWLCPRSEDHEWQAALGHRTRGRRGCPYCAGQKVSVTNSLASIYPSIADECHPTKNGDLTPDKVVAGSNKKFWWRCPKAPDHEWQANLNSRTHRTHPAGCPFCRALKVSKTNSLASCFPKVAVEWHPTKNGD